jgi:Transposase, Mutator family
MSPHHAPLSSASPLGLLSTSPRKPGPMPCAYLQADDARREVFHASHLIARTRQEWTRIARDLKPVHTAATEAGAAARFEEFAQAWDNRYPAITKLWRQPGPSSRRSCSVRRGNQEDHLYHQRDQVAQRPQPARRERPRPLPQRAGRPEMPLPRDPFPGPHRPR